MSAADEDRLVGSYTLASLRIATAIFERDGVNNATSIVARNGGRLEEPACTSIELEHDAGVGVGDEVRAIASATLADVQAITDEFLSVAPVVSAQRWMDEAIGSADAAFA